MHYAIFIILGIIGYVVYKKGGITIPKTTITTGDPDVVSESGLPVTESGAQAKMPGLIESDLPMPSVLQSKKAASDLNVVCNDPVRLRQQIDDWYNDTANRRDILQTGENVLRAFQSAFPNVPAQVNKEVTMGQLSWQAPGAGGMLVSDPNFETIKQTQGIVAYIISLIWQIPASLSTPVVAHPEPEPVELVKTVTVPPLESTIPEVPKTIFSTEQNAEGQSTAYWSTLFWSWFNSPGGGHWGDTEDSTGASFVRTFRAQFPQFTLTELTITRQASGNLWTVIPHFLGPDGSKVN